MGLNLPGDHPINISPNALSIDQSGVLRVNEALNYNWGSKLTARISVSDPQGATTSKEFSLSVNNVPEAPVINDGLDSISLNFIEDGGVLLPNGWDRTLEERSRKLLVKFFHWLEEDICLLDTPIPMPQATGLMNHGLTDGWVVKIDTNGSKVWDKAYGGSERDYLYDGAQTDDGGFLLAGYSQSDVSGEKSANSKGGYDYWMIKIDSNGNKLWDKTLGGMTKRLPSLPY